MARAKRVEFTLLTTPSAGVGSFSGNQDWRTVRHVPQGRITLLGIPRQFHHRWDDGWSASIDARVMEPGERTRKSDGFLGYEWMVDRILRWGDTTCRCEWVPDLSSTRAGAWEQCRLCRCSRRVQTVTSGGDDGR